MMFNPVFIADKQSLLPLCSRAVCIILHDDTRYTGILTSCGTSSIVLNGERTNRPVNRTRKVKIQAEEGKTSIHDHTSQTASGGTLSLGPLIEYSTVKAVIPFALIRQYGLIALSQPSRYDEHK
jgi:hypothetical protein